MVSLLFVLFLGGCGDKAPLPVVTDIDSARLKRFDADTLLYEIVSVLPDSHGVWALSARSPYLYRFDPGGGLRKVFATRGKGPGELGTPWSIQRGRGNAVEVWDLGTHIIMGFSEEGVFQHATPIELAASAVRADMREISYGEANKLRSFAGGWILQVEPGGVTQTRDFERSVLVRLDSAGRPRDSLLDFRTLPGRATPTSAYSLVSIPLWTVCGADRLVVFNPATREVAWFDSSGDRIQSTAVDLPRTLLEERDILFHMRHILQGELRGQDVPLAEMEKLATRIVREKREFFPKEAPLAVDLVCDEQGRPWLNLFSTTDDPLGYSREWLIMADHPRRVRFPVGFRVHQVGRDRVFGTIRDENGVQRIATVPTPVF